MVIARHTCLAKFTAPSHLNTPLSDKVKEETNAWGSNISHVGYCSSVALKLNPLIVDEIIKAEIHDKKQNQDEDETIRIERWMTNIYSKSPKTQPHLHTKQHASAEAESIASVQKRKMQREIKDHVFQQLYFKPLPEKYASAIRRADDMKKKSTAAALESHVVVDISEITIDYDQLRPRASGGGSGASSSGSIFFVVGYRCTLRVLKVESSNNNSNNDNILLTPVVVVDVEDDYQTATVATVHGNNDKVTGSDTVGLRVAPLQEHEAAMNQHRIKKVRDPKWSDEDDDDEDEHQEARPPTVIYVPFQRKDLALFATNKTVLDKKSSGDSTSSMLLGQTILMMIEKVSLPASAGGSTTQISALLPPQVFPLGARFSPAPAGGRRNGAVKRTRVSFEDENKMTGWYPQPIAESTDIGQRSVHLVFHSQKPDSAAAKKRLRS